MLYYIELFAPFLTANRRPKITLKKNIFFCCCCSLTSIIFYLLFHYLAFVGGVKFFKRVFTNILNPCLSNPAG